MKLTSNYHSIQGEFWMGGRAGLDYDPDDDDLVAPSTGLTFMGNVSSAEIALERNNILHTESFTGNRGTDFAMAGKSGGTLTLRVEDLTVRNNLMCMFGGDPGVITTGDVTGATLCELYASYPYYRIVRPARGVAANRRYAFCYRLPRGQWVPYRNVATESLVVTDSTATPKTLVIDTNFRAINWRNGTFSFNDLTTGGPFVLPFTANLTHGVVIDKLSQHITFGTKFRLSHGDISDCVVKDSAVSPATVDPDYYELFDDEGCISFRLTTRADFLDEEYVDPIRVIYTANSSIQLPIMQTKQPPKWWVYFKGIDTANDNALIMADFYAVQFRMNGALQLMNNEGFAGCDLVGDLMLDHNMDAEGPMGQIGRIMPIQVYD